MASLFATVTGVSLSKLFGPVKPFTVEPLADTSALPYFTKMQNKRIQLCGSPAGLSLLVYNEKILGQPAFIATNARLNIETFITKAIFKINKLTTKLNKQIRDCQDC